MQNQAEDHGATEKIYFIREKGDDKMVKIGKTANEVEKRVSQLQTGNHRVLYEKFHIERPAKFKYEKLLHKLFSHDKILNEWFNIPDEILDGIKDTCNKNLDYDSEIRELIEKNRKIVDSEVGRNAEKSISKKTISENDVMYSILLRIIYDYFGDIDDRWMYNMAYDVSSKLRNEFVVDGGAICESALKIDRHKRPYMNSESAFARGYDDGNLYISFDREKKFQVTTEAITLGTKTYISLGFDNIDYISDLIVKHRKIHFYESADVAKHRLFLMLKINDAIGTAIGFNRMTKCVDLWIGEYCSLVGLQRSGYYYAKNWSVNGIMHIYIVFGDLVVEHNHTICVAKFINNEFRKRFGKHIENDVVDMEIYNINTNMGLIGFSYLSVSKEMNKDDIRTDRAANMITYIPGGAMTMKCCKYICKVK